jgi:hypothetical protein
MGSLRKKPKLSALYDLPESPAGPIGFTDMFSLVV